MVSACQTWATMKLVFGARSLARAAVSIPHIPSLTLARRPAFSARAHLKDTDVAYCDGTCDRPSLLFLASVHEHCKLNEQLEVVVKGAGKHQGCNVAWQLRWRCGDGAFVEKVKGRHINYVWGFDGGTLCWEEDDSGCARPLHLDDFEAVLLAGLIRTGAWALPAGQRLLHIGLSTGGADHQSSAASALQGPPNPAFVGSTFVVTDQLLQGDSHAAEDDGRVTSAAAAGQHVGVVLAVRLRGGKIVAHVEVCGNSWRPLSMASHICTDNETWAFEDWRDWPDGPSFPARTLHNSGCGGLHAYLVDTLTALSPADMAKGCADTLLASSYIMPQPPLVPADARFLSGVPAATPAWFCPSGHIAVRPTINGQQAGFMMLDTGASGFVIDPAAADQLGLRPFGELHVTGMTGKVRSNFRRGDNFQLGPLVMDRPLFMEMSCAGLVRGAPGPVIGIIGYEVFRRAIVDIPPRPSRPPAQPLTMAADSSIVTSAAAFAASLATRKQRKPKGHSSSDAGAVQYCIYLHSPELGDKLETPLAGSVTSGGIAGYCRAAAGQCSSKVGGRSTSNYPSSSSSCSSSTHASPSRTPGPPSPAQEVGVTAVAPGTGRSSFGSVGRLLSRRALESLPWVPVIMIANLPHVEVRYTPGAAPGLDPTSSFFMLDSGAGGVDLMVNARAAADFDLGKPASRHQRYIRGVGGDEAGRVRVTSSTLGWVEVGGVRFEGARALLAESEGAGGSIELSLYTAGIICGDLLSQCRMVLDYARNRVALVPEGAGVSSP